MPAPRGNRNARRHGLYSQVLGSQKQRADYRSIRAALSADGGRELLEAGVAVTEVMLVEFHRRKPDESTWTDEEREAVRRARAEVRQHVEAIVGMNAAERADDTQPVGPSICFIDSTKLGSASQITACRAVAGGVARIATLADGDRLLTLIERSDGTWAPAREQIINAELQISGYAEVLPVPAVLQ